VLQDAARVGLLTGLGSGMYRIHPALPGYLAAGWRAEDPAGYGQEREACEQALRAACAELSRWLTEQIESGNAALAYAVMSLQRRTLSATLGHALDHRAWADAEDISRALDPYWDTRGLGEEAAAWTDRILDATIAQATRQKDAGEPDRAAYTYRHALAYLQNQSETEWTRSNISVIYHVLGMTAQNRGQLDEAEDWYRKSLTIFEELGDRPHLALVYAQLGLLAEARNQVPLALGSTSPCRRRYATTSPVSKTASLEARHERPSRSGRPVSCPDPRPRPRAAPSR